MKDLRLEEIKNWLSVDLNIKNFQINVASADASFRRYFRLFFDDNSFIIMDAPPKKENCKAFIKIASLIEVQNVQAPHIFDFNEKQGFMRLSDLGDTAYLTKLNDQTADDLYDEAIQAIVKMQAIDASLPIYDSTLLRSEMSSFTDWYLKTHLDIGIKPHQQKILLDTFDFLTASALKQQVAFVHRDYHSRNLMITDENNPGVIDFQDAVNGPITYDLVSLIKDCYISWPRHKQLAWIDIYLTLSDIEIDKDVFIKQLDLMGMQRHLKAIGIFSRLNHRDGKAAYLNDIPRTLAYIFDVCQRYEELSGFLNLLTVVGLSVDKKLLEQIQ